MGFLDGIKKIGGGVGEMWDSSGGKVVSGVADAGEAAIGGAANVAKGVGEAGANVVTFGQYGQNKEQQALLSKQSEQLDALRKDLKDRNPDTAEPGGDEVNKVAASAPESKASMIELAGGDRDKITGDLDKVKVEEGQTLSGIAESHGKTIDQLLEANPDIVDANQIGVGQELNLGEPVAAAKPEGLASIEHAAGEVSAPQPVSADVEMGA